MIPNATKLAELHHEFLVSLETSHAISSWDNQTDEYRERAVQAMSHVVWTRALAVATVPDEMPMLEFVVEQVVVERMRQHAVWGEQNHRDGVAHANLGGGIHDTAEWWGLQLEVAARRQLSEDPTFAAILAEEVGEVLQEPDKDRLAVELVQVAAVAIAWVEKLLRDDRTEVLNAFGRIGGVGGA